METNTWPFAVAAAHRRVVGQETLLTWKDEGSLVIFQPLAGPVGEVVVRTAADPSAAPPWAQKLAVAQEIGSKAA